jgi:alkylresorcinol/alkylpyrone synthase
VDRRYSVLPLGELAARRSLSDTIGIYREHALALGRKVTAACLDRAGLRATDVDLLITVSCTGFMIPSLDAYLVNALGFRPDVRRLPITELGCLGGAAALARAHDFVQGHPNANVLVISVELPTLSFQRDDASLANLVSTAIFGDGAAAAIVTGREVPGPAILDTRAHLFPTSEQALGFELRDTGFHVLLAKELPAMVRSEIDRLVAELLGRWKLGRADLSFFLLHPGGRKILAAVEEALAIDRAETQTAWDVMRECGNLSSATVFFILERHLARPTLTPAGAHGLLAGFGPGFSTELLLLRWR